MSRELPKDRLATTDETGKRVYLYPAAVKGKYHSRRRWVHPLLLLVFMVLPWIYVGGRQLLLLDIAHREFFFFGLHFRAHDAPFVLFLLLGFTFLIGLITAIWGRLWCGWACPQTVFTEALFRRIEAWIEGNHRDRKALDEGGWSSEKILKKSAKWAVFTLVSLVITHSFLAYFVGSRELIGMVSSSPAENWASFLVILFTTGLILFDFGWFREQFCVIMCPYGRFQSVMLDSQSMVVGYDPRRGEPRRGTQAPGAPAGDCVDCFRCVQVCPTGIDIRRGLQMECIACTACIDACDEVMTKIKKPLGLISYTTLAELNGRRRRKFTGRAGIYAGLLLIAVTTLTVLLTRKEFLEVTVLRAGGSPYEIIPAANGNLVLNHFRVDLSNQTGAAQQVQFSLADPEPGLELVMPMNPLQLDDRAAQKADFFVRFPPTLLKNGARRIFLKMTYPHNEKKLEVPLVGPNA
jgi:cytochrome c oxidase accessory protein FixG